MEPQQMTPGSDAAPPARVLASADTNGHEVQIVEGPARRLVITFDGQAQPGYSWNSHQLEQCMRTYLGLIRHRPVAVE